MACQGHAEVEPRPLTIRRTPSGAFSRRGRWREPPLRSAWRLDACPALDDLAVGESPDNDALERDFLSARAVGGVPDVATHDLVAFGDHVLDRDLEIRKAGMHAAHHRLVAFAIDRFAARTIVVEELGS